MEFLNVGWVIRQGELEVGDGSAPLFLDNRARLWVEKDTVLIGNLAGLEIVIGETAWFSISPSDAIAPDAPPGS